MQFQIILLPQEDYWAWVRACKDYVLTYGAYLTSDPQTAATYRYPRQIVTYAELETGYPISGTIGSWLRSNHPEVALDPIAVDAPDALQAELARRIAEEDRFGRRQRGFFLHWPTDYPVITQRFGANPQIYSRFGFPGHEGVDIRALPNTPIYAGADGEVYQVHTNPKTHAYGIHVRIRHRDGYRTVYGHLAKALVRTGETVKAGQLIGRANSTGASVGSHLHLSLKRDYATERAETDYPKDIIDPTEFLLWPDQPKTLREFQWPAGRCLIGGHARLGARLEAPDLGMIQLARLEAVMIAAGEQDETLDQLRRLNPAMFLMARLSAAPQGAYLPARVFASHQQDEIGRLYRAGVRYLELGCNPNLQFDGWGHAWEGGAGFGQWFLEASERLHGSFPELKLGFPGLSPGGAVSGQREQAIRFLDQAIGAVLAADWVGVNCYWTDSASLDDLNAGRLYQEYRIQLPDKLLFVTEFGNPAAGIPAEEKARQYLEFLGEVRQEPGVGAAFAMALSADTGYDNLVWRQGESIGPIPMLLGKREF